MLGVVLLAALCSFLCYYVLSFLFPIFGRFLIFLASQAVFSFFVGFLMVGVIAGIIYGVTRLYKGEIGLLVRQHLSDKKKDWCPNVRFVSKEELSAVREEKININLYTALSSRFLLLWYTENRNQHSDRVGHYDLLWIRQDFKNYTNNLIRNKKKPLNMLRGR